MEQIIDTKRESACKRQAQKRLKAGSEAFIWHNIPPHSKDGDEAEAIADRFEEQKLI